MMPEIMLGIFHTLFWEDMRVTNGWDEFPFPSLEGKTLGKTIKVSWPSNRFVEGLIEKVSAASVINFMLDEIYLPLNPFESVSCGELMCLIEHNLTYKVKFWLKGVQIPTEKVLRLIEKVEQDEITFENIDFNTL